ncbi:hypothetical protein BT69DRAFT_1332029 [Atractiella rhizophila]|nr:hypothetical protein BT69DRAFT_1332029 [Atractiella rhizophila]
MTINLLSAIPFSLLYILLSALPARSQDVTSIALNPPQVFSFNTSASPSTAFFSLPPSSSQTFISLSLCSASAPPGRRTTLYLSNSTSVQFPTSDSHLPPAQSIRINDGAASFRFDKSDDGIFIGVTTTDAGEWELGVSGEDAGFFHDVQPPVFIWEDSDSTHSLLRRATNFTSDTPPQDDMLRPLVLKTGVVPDFLSGSVCAVRRANVATSGGQGEGNWTMFVGAGNRTVLGAGRRVEWFGDQLQGGTNYTFWEFEQTGTDGSAILSGPSYFVTKQSSNCFLPPPNHPLLEICPSLTYSIPAPSNLPTGVTLESFFVPILQKSLTNFNLTLSTFPCNNRSISEGTYSFISTCSDCFAAYRLWLCSIVLPRCTDLPGSFSPPFNSSGFIPNDTLSVFPRTDPPSSRTPFFAPDALPQGATSPFPYGEILPCDANCQRVGATCPPFMGWQCPLKDVTREAGYAPFQKVFSLEADGTKGVEEGVRGPEGLGERGSDRWGNVFCNAVGSDIILAMQIGAAARTLVPSFLVLLVSLAVGALYDL